MPNSVTHTVSGSARPPAEPHHPVAMSEYHTACVPAVDRERAAAIAAALARRAATSTSGSRSSSLEALIKGDALTRDRFWKRAIWMEKKAAADWETNWKFVTDYDWKGDPRSDESRTSEEDGASEKPAVVFQSEASNYGRQVDTQLGRKLQQQQHQFDVKCRRCTQKSISAQMC